MACRSRPEGSKDAGQGSEQEAWRRVESIPQRPASEGASGARSIRAQVPSVL